MDSEDASGSGHSSHSIDSPCRIESITTPQAEATRQFFIPTTGSPGKQSSDLLRQREERLYTQRKDVGDLLAERAREEQVREEALFQMRLESKLLRDEQTKMVEKMQIAQKIVDEHETVINERIKMETRELESRARDAVARAHQSDLALQKAEGEIQILRDKVASLQDDLDSRCDQQRHLELRLRDYEHATSDQANVFRGENSQLSLQNFELQQTALALKKKRAEDEGKLRELRREIDVLTNQLRTEESLRRSAERRVAELNAKAKGGALVELDTVTQLRDAVASQKDELIALRNNNRRLLTIVHQSKELGDVIQPLANSDEEFVFCGYRYMRDSDAMLVGGVERHRDLLMHPQLPSEQPRLLLQLQLAVESHNQSVRNLEHIVAAKHAPIEQNIPRHRETDYWVPWAAFVEASAFRRVQCPSTEIDVFYEFLLKLNGIWRDRMKMRMKPMTSSAARQAPQQAAVRQHFGDRPSSKRRAATGTSATRSLQSATNERHRNLQALRKLQRQVQQLSPIHTVRQVMLEYHQIAAKSIEAQHFLEQQVADLRLQIRDLVASRDPHIASVQSACWFLAIEVDRGARRLRAELSQSLNAFEKVWRTMQSSVPELSVFNNVFEDFIRHTTTAFTSECQALVDRAEQVKADLHTLCAEINLDDAEADQYDIEAHLPCEDDGFFFEEQD